MDTCEHWQTHQVVPNPLADVYDGDMWFSHPNSFGLLLKIGLNLLIKVFMLLVLYLWPCLIFHVMFATPRIKNIFQDPRNHINPFLEPLVEGLLHSWKGKDITLPTGKL